MAQVRSVRSLTEQSTIIYKSIVEVNKKLSKACGRVIEKEVVETTFRSPGFRIKKSLSGAFSNFDEPCTVEPPDNSQRKFGFPRDLFLRS